MFCIYLTYYIDCSLLQHEYISTCKDLLDEVCIDMEIIEAMFHTWSRDEQGRGEFGRSLDSSTPAIESLLWDDGPTFSRSIFLLLSRSTQYY